MLFTLLIACADDPTPVADVESPAAEVLVELDPPRLLRRLSLELRGTLPTVEELDAVEADPSLLDSYQAQFLDDDRFEERYVRLLAERWRTRLDKFELQYYDFDLEPEQEYEFDRAVGEEPLRLMAHVAVNDLPWTDIVTADYTMANELLGSIWPLEYPTDGSGWEVSRYTDGRPAGGVLTTNGLWWRYITNISNMNRARVAAISRLLLCQDMLARPVSLSGAVALSDENGTANAIKSNDGCISCHSAIEPLASSLFGFWTVISYNPDELSTYHAERERMGEEYLGYEPGYFGKPLGGLVDLGPAIANDSRFYWCAAEGTAEVFWHRSIDEDDFDQIEALRQSFVDNDILMRPLIDAVLDTPEWRAGALTDEATEADEERYLTWRNMSPDLASDAIEDVTGFRWMYEGFDQMDNDDPGYRVLAGGVDGYQVNRTQQDPGMTWALTRQRLAQAAASSVVTADLTAGAERKALQFVTVDSRPGDEDFTAELEALHWRLYAVRADDERLAALGELWTSIHEFAGPTEAWSRTLSVMLRDPEFLGY